MALSAEQDGEVWVLVDDVDTARRYFEVVSGQPPGTNLRYLTRRGPKAVWRFLRGRHVFYTHGLFGSPVPRLGRVHVNLWHGHGPKATAVLPGRRRPPSPYLVANTAVWGGETARAQKVEPDRLILSRHPRQDAFGEPPRRDLLARLGLDPAAKLVLWMPTYRQARAVNGRSSWSDVAAPSSSMNVIREAAGVLAAEAEDGVEILAKFHPLDTSAGSETGIRSLAPDEHWAAGISTYQLLAMADALISDYSSVWVEYLELDRPLALYCPDLTDYESGRGFKTPPISQVAGGLVIHTLEGLAEFVRSVRSTEQAGRDARTAARSALALTDTATDTASLVRDLFTTAHPVSGRPQ